MKKEEKKDKKSKKKKNNSRLTTILLGVIFIAGLGILAYPAFSDWWNRQHATRAIASYQEQVEQIDDSTKKEMLEAAREYNDSLEVGVHYNLTDEAYEKYESILDVSGTGIMGYVQIPSINVNLPIYHGTDETVLQIAAGHIAGSSLPIGGERTHAVISGHRGLPSAKLFTDLDRLVEGDVFQVTVLDQVVTYRIDQIHIVLPEETTDLAIEPGKDYMTLVTCTPYGINSHRMLIRGHRIDNLESEEELIVVSEAKRISATKVMFIIGIPMIMAALVSSYIISAVRKPKKTAAQILEELEHMDWGGRDNGKQS